MFLLLFIFDKVNLWAALKTKAKLPVGELIEYLGDQSSPHHHLN
jgi:hypothetical protein